LATALATQGAAADQTFSEQLLGWIVSALIGAFFALLVSFLVQDRIAPHSAAKIRREERWENDLLKLWNLLNEQVERAVKRYRLVVGTERWWQAQRDEPGLTTCSTRTVSTSSSDGWGPSVETLAPPLMST